MRQFLTQLLCAAFTHVVTCRLVDENESVIEFSGNILVVGKNRIGTGGKYKLLMPWKATVYVGFV